MKKGLLFVVVLVCVAFCITLAGCGKTAAVTIDTPSQVSGSAAIIAEPKLAGSVSTAEKLCGLLGTTLRSAVDIEGTINVTGAEADTQITGEISAKLGELAQASDNPLSLLLDRSLSADFVLDYSSDAENNTEESANIFFHDGRYYLYSGGESITHNIINEYAAIANDAYPQKLKELYGFYKQEEVLNTIKEMDEESYLYAAVALSVFEILEGADIGATLDFYFDGIELGEPIIDFWQTIADTLEIDYNSTIYELLVSDLFTLTDDGSTVNLIVNNPALTEIMSAIDSEAYSPAFLDELENGLFIGVSFDYTGDKVDGIDINYYMEHPALPGEYYVNCSVALDIQALSPDYVFEAPAAAAQLWDTVESADLQEGYDEALDVVASEEPYYIRNHTAASDEAIAAYVLDLLGGDLNVCLLGNYTKYDHESAGIHNEYRTNNYCVFIEPDGDELYNLFGVRCDNPLLFVFYDGFNDIGVTLLDYSNFNDVFGAYWELGKTERFELNADGTYTLVECVANADQYAIPAEYEGAAVTGIAEGAFDYADIGTLTIPASVKSIPQLITMRYTTKRIDNIILLSGIETIENYAFYNTHITSILIPASVTSVGSHIARNTVIVDFEDESGTNYCYDGHILYTADKTEILGVYGIDTLPSSLLLPKELVSIGSNMFGYIDTLTSVSFEDGSALQTIGSYAFYDTGITEITVPASVISLGDRFVDYRSVNIIIEEGNTVYDTRENILYRDSKSQIVAVFDIENMPAVVTLPKELVAIPDNLFRYSSSFSYEDDMPVYNLGATMPGPAPEPIEPSYPAYEFERIISVTVEEGSVLQSIGECAFYYTSITGFVIPQSVTDIAPDAFIQDEPTLMSLTFGWEQIPETVEIIEISDTEIMTVFITAGDAEDYGGIFDAAAINILDLSSMDEDGFAIQDNVLLVYMGDAKDIVIPANVTAIAETAFLYTPNLRSVDLTLLAEPVSGFAFDGAYLIVPDEDYTEYLGYIQALSFSDYGESLLNSLKNLLGYDLSGNIYTVSEVSRVVKASWVQEDGTIVADMSFVLELEEIIGEYNLCLLQLSSLAIGLGSDLSEIVIPIEEGYGNNTEFIISYKIVLLYMMMLDDPEGLYELLGLEESSFENIYGLFDDALEDETKRASIAAYAETVPYFLGYLGSAAEVTIPEGVRILEMQAFQMADSVTKIILPDSLLLYVPTSTEALTQLFASQMADSGMEEMLQMMLNTMGIYLDSYTYSRVVLNEVVKKLGIEKLSSIINLPAFEEFAVSETNPYYTAFGGALYLNFYGLISYLYANLAPQSTYDALMDALDGYQDVWILCALPTVLTGDTFEVMEGVRYFSADSLIMHENITKLSLPSTLQEINFGNKQFTSITIDEDNTYIALENGLLLNADRTIILGVAGTDVVIPNTVTDISFAFKGSAVESVEFEAGSLITDIGESAFENCFDLILISIPNSVTSIGYRAFDNCFNLASIVLPQYLEIIEGYAFNNCSSLLSIGIPDSVTDIGYHAFSGCEELSAVYITDLTAWCGINFSSNPIDNAEGLWDLYINGVLTTSLTIPIGITEIETYVFSNCSITALTLNEGLETIGHRAFEYCTSLQSVNIPAGVTSIGSYAFNGCSALATLTLNEGLETIESCTFYYCISLQSVNIPGSVTSIGSYAFEHCTALTTLTLNEGLETIGQSAFGYCILLQSVNIPGSVTSIEDYTFNDCTALTTLTLNEGLETIGYYAFEYCTSLQSVVVPDGVIEIGGRAFYGCSALQSLSLPASLTTLGGGMFVGTNLSSLVFRPGGRYIVSGDYVIDTLTNTLTAVWKDISGAVLIFEGIEYIGESAFTGTEITSVTFPSTLIGIGDYAFQGCPDLTGQIVFPEGLESIGYCCFDSTDVSSYIVPISVTFIDWNAFGWDPITIYGAVGSYAETYANDKGYNFETLGYLIVGLVFEGGANPYLGYTVKAYVNDREDSRYIYADTENLNFGTVLAGDSVTVVVLTPGGKTVFTRSTVVDYDDDDTYYFEIEAVSTLKSVTLIVTDENDNVLTSGFGVKWYQDGELVSTSKTVSGLQNTDNLYYTVVLSQKLGIRYQEVANVEVVGDASPITVKLVPLQTAEITGRLTNSGGDPLSNVIVLAKQNINGFYTQTSAVTDENGDFAVTVAQEDTQIVFSKNGYYNASATVAKGDLSAGAEDIGSVALSSLDGNTVDIMIMFAPAVYPQAEQTYAEVATYNDFVFTVFNITDNVVLSEFVLSDKTIVLQSGTASSGDELRITATDTSGALKPGSITVVMDSDLTADGEFRLNSLGEIVINTPQKNNAKNILFVFDETGYLFGSYTYTGNTFKATALPSGDYSVVAMGYAAALAGVKTVSALTTLGLVQGVDYVIADTTVTDGIISAVAFDAIPLLDENKLLFTETAATHITLSQSSVVTGNNVSVRVSYTFKTGYTTSGQEVLIQLPRGSRLYTDSIYMGGSKLASSAYTLDSNYVLTVRTLRASAKITFNIAPANPENAVIDANISFIYENERRLQKIGSAALEVSSLSLAVPKIVGRTQNIIISGYALSGSVVRVFDNNTFVGSAAAYSSGRWQVAVEISADRIHDIYASIITADSLTLKTTTQRLIYDDTYPELTAITMYNRGGSTSFDFITPPRNVPYFSYIPGYDDFSFKVVLSNAESVTKTRVIIRLVSGVYEYVTAKYDSAKGYFVAGVKLGDGIPASIGFEYMCEGQLVSASMPVNAIIDPSGYVYEAVTSNRLEGVTATIYYKESLADTDAIIWNADDFGQSNPLYTDSEGNYAWDVPSGWWQIMFEKAGYETAYSEWLPVPPVQEDINIAMTAIADIAIAGVNGYAGYIDIELSQYVAIADNDFQNDIILDLRQGGSLIAVYAEYLEVTEGYSKTIRLTPESGSFENTYLLSGEWLTSYNNSVLYINGYAIDIVAEPANLYADCGGELALDYGETLQIAIFADNADGYTVSAESQNGAIASIQVIQAEIGAEGALFDITGALTGVTTVYIQLVGTSLTYQITVTVAEMEGDITVDNPTSNFGSGYCLVGQQILLMTEQEGAGIYYSTDGSNPSAGSNLYQSPITPASGLNIKYVAAIGNVYSDIQTLTVTTVKATITFRIEGQSDTVLLVDVGTDLNPSGIPAIPERTDYVAAWDVTDFDNIQNNMVVTAIYTKLLTLTYRADGTDITVRKLLPGSVVADIPDVPSKQYHTGVWSVTDYASLNADTVIVAVYTRNSVTITFKAQGSADIVRTVGQGLALTSIPAIPAKQYHTGVWDTQNFSTVTSSFTVNAVYTRNQVSVVFQADGATITTKTVGQGLALTDIPTPPAKEGYTASWSITDFSHITADTTVTCVYTAIPEDPGTEDPGTNQPAPAPKSNLKTIFFVVLGLVAAAVVIIVIAASNKRRVR